MVNINIDMWLMWISCVDDIVLSVADMVVADTVIPMWPLVACLFSKMLN